MTQRFTLPLWRALGKPQFYLIRDCRQGLRFSNNAFRVYCSSKDRVEFETIRISQDGKNMNDVHSCPFHIMCYSQVTYCWPLNLPILLTLAYLHQILASRTGPHIRRPWLSRSPHMAMIPLEGCLAAYRIHQTMTFCVPTGSLTMPGRKS